MRKLLISSAVILPLVGGASAIAAPKATKTAAPATAAASATTSKSADCAKQWKAEKKHSQTRKAGASPSWPPAPSSMAAG